MVKRLSLYLSLICVVLSSTLYAQSNIRFEALALQGFDIVNIENDGVRRYMEDRSYDSPEYTGRYSYSVVKRYTSGSGSTPHGKEISWQPISARESVVDLVVKVSESPAFDKDLKLYYPEDTCTSYTICNMRPNTRYYYKVEEVLRNGSKITVGGGKFYTIGKVRMLRVGGMHNVRDFGGWDTSFGVKICYGRLFRGNRADVITETGKNDFVKNEHITADLDLRGRDLGRSPMGPLSEVDYYCTNNSRYKSALVSGQRALANDLTYIAKVLRRGGNVFMHCNHGVNRCGTLSFIIDGILGLSEADLSRTYELSSFAYGNFRNSTFGEMLPVIRSYGQPGDNLTQCFYNYALRIGVSEEDLDLIRCTMLGLKKDDKRIVNAHRTFSFEE